MDTQEESKKRSFQPFFHNCHACCFLSLTVQVASSRLPPIRCIGQSAQYQTWNGVVTSLLTARVA